MSSNILLDDKFTVLALNKDGKYYERGKKIKDNNLNNTVSRIDAKSDIYDIVLQLDINSEIYPMEKGKEYNIAIAKSISSEGGEDKGVYNADELNKSSLLDEYQYCMYGKIFKVSEGKNNEMTICASFGGLLMSLKGNHQYLKNMQNDIRIYILIKSV